jgi:hypothetical protein
VAEERRAASPDFTSLLQVRALSEREDFLVAGTIIGREHQPRLVHALGYEVEIELDRLMLFIVNEDRRAGSAGSARFWETRASISPTWPSRGTGAPVGPSWR